MTDVEPPVEMQFDPARGPPTTVDELRVTVGMWHADRNNAGREFPYQSAAHVRAVLDIFIAVLRKNGRDVARHEGEWRLHDDDDGLWHRVDVSEILTLFQEFWQAVTGRTATARRIIDAVSTLATLPAITPAAAAWNGVLRGGAHVTLFGCGTLLIIATDGSLVTRRAARDDYLTPEICPRLAARWDPRATCKQTEDALYRVFGWHLPPERAARVETLLAWASQILLPGMRPKKTYRAAVFFGESDTGKSVLLNVPRAVLDEPGASSAVCTMPLSSLDSAFGLSSLLGTRAWLVNEVRTANRLMSDDLLKQIISNEPLTVPVKYRPAVDTQLGVLVGVATNALPKMDDVSDGTLSRLVYFETRIRFVPKVSAGAKPDSEQAMIPDLYRIMVGERDGIAQLLVRAACAMVKAGEMPISQAMLDETRATYGAEDTVWQFVEQALQPEADPEHRVMNTIIKRAYRGMIEAEEGLDAVRKLDMRWTEKRLFAKLVFEHDAKPGRKRVPGAGRLAAAPRAHHGVWLTAKGIEWLQWGMRRDDGSPGKPLSDYLEVAKRANLPQPVLGGNVVAMPAPAAKRTD